MKRIIAKYLFIPIILFTFYSINPLIIEERNGSYYYNINYVGKLLYPLIPIEDYIIYDKHKIQNILNKYNFNDYIKHENIEITYKPTLIEIIMQIGPYKRIEHYEYKNGLIIENYVKINGYIQKYYNYQFKKNNSPDSTSFDVSILHSYDNKRVANLNIYNQFSIDIPYSRLENFLSPSIDSKIKNFHTKDHDLVNKYLNFQKDFIKIFDHYKPFLYGVWKATDDAIDIMYFDTVYCHIFIYSGICMDYKIKGNSGSFKLVYWDHDEKKEIIEPIIFEMNPDDRVLKLKFTNYNDPWIIGYKLEYEDNIDSEYKIMFSSPSLFGGMSFN